MNHSFHNIFVDYISWEDYRVDHRFSFQSYNHKQLLAKSQLREQILMKFNQHERTLLNILADEWEKSGPPGYMETSIIAERLGLPIADAKSTVRALFVKGMVDTDQVDTFAAYLTPEGYDLARKK